MKVMCIDAKSSHRSESPCDLIEGQIYTVEREVSIIDIYGALSMGYDLAEMPDKKYAYAKTRFAPISDINKPELIKEQKVEMFDETN